MCKKVTSECKLILVYLSLLFFSYSLLACTFHETNFIVKASMNYSCAPKSWTMKSLQMYSN